MEKIRTLIVDDELRARQGVRTLLTADPEIEIIGECSNGQQALKDITELHPDLVLLDIQMPGLNGFEVLAALDLTQAPSLIFVTAYDQYALKAFEVNALDYLLKPFTDERFRHALSRVKAQHQQRQSGDLREHLGQLRQLLTDYQSGRQTIAATPLQRFPIRKSGAVHYIPVNEIDWLEADGYCTKLHTGKTVHLLRGNLGSFEALLDSKKFTRINRSAIVNLHCVQCLKNWFHGECLALLKDGTELKVSSAQRRRLEQLLEQLA